MPPVNKKRKISVFSDTNVTRLLSALVAFRNSSSGVEINEDQTIVHLIDKLMVRMHYHKLKYTYFYAVMAVN